MLCRYYVDFYVDDVSNKNKSIESTISLISDIPNMCKCGGLRLINFSSNNENILKSNSTSELKDSSKLELALGVCGQK